MSRDCVENSMDRAGRPVVADAMLTGYLGTGGWRLIDQSVNIADSQQSAAI